MTRVLFLAPSSSLYAGVARWLVDLNVGLMRSGIRCTTAIAEGSRFHDSLKFRRAYPQLDYIVLDGRTGSAAGRRLAALEALRTVRPDIVMPVMLASGLEAAAQEKAKGQFRIVYPVHEINPGVSRDLARYAPWLDAVVFVDNSSHDHYIGECEPVRSRAHLIPCGAPSARIAPTARVFGAPVRIGFCGRIEQAPKRVLDLVPLCRELSSAGVDFELLIAGEGGLESSLRDDLSKLAAPPRVTFLGALDRDRLYCDFYPNVDCLVICSECETGPLVAFEAMANGCLVVTSDFAGRTHNRILVDGETCLVFPVADMASAASCVQRAVAQPEWARSISERGRAVAQRDRSLDVSTRDWAALIGQLSSAPALLPSRGAPARTRSGGMLEALALTDAAAERVRRTLGRRFRHSSATEEWPPYAGSS